jgi:acetyl esterase/lipase
MNTAILGLALTALAAGADRPSVELLWPKGSPGAVGTEAADRPTLTLYLPPAEKATGAGVVICPGGGYGTVVDTYEGKDPAEWLTKRGVAGFVLRYRVAPRYRHPAPLQDVQRALRLVRARAKEWHVDPRRLGVWGFSAGGHLAATAATHFDDGKADADDPVDRAGCRPDFAILCYPVISMEPKTTHGGSRNSLLGREPDASLVELMSNDRQVTPQTPPTFLFHTNADAAVPAENSVLFYLALRKAKVPAELHIYEKGAHGVGLAPKDPVLSTWPELLAAWLNGRGLLKKG